MVLLAGLTAGVESKNAGETETAENSSMLSGFVVANVFDDTARVHRLGLLYPVVEIPGGQAVVVDAVKDGDVYVVETVLRIRFDTQATENMRFALGRHLRVVVSLRRPDASLPERFVGNRVNMYRVDVLAENGSVYVDVPFYFSTTRKDERIELRMLVAGSLLGVFLGSHPVVVRSVIEFNCNVSGVSDDVTPPVTIICFEGNERR